MSFRRLSQLIIFQAFTAILFVAVSCNSKTNEGDDEIVVTPAMVAVKEFYIKANDSVLAKIDSVFFTIDLNNGVIFNADSLPKGTIVAKLVPSITFANTMSKAELTFTRENGTDTTTNYLDNPGDTINFTHPVTLNVTAQDETNSFSYLIKVNIHKQEPDTLIWDKLSTTPLPSRYTNPIAQKTVYKGSTTYSLIEEYNGEFTLSTCSDLNEGDWDKEEISFNFVPNLDSFTSTSDKFYILSNTGDLYSSSDIFEWNSTDENLTSILGGYGSSILGISEINGILSHIIYPKPEYYVPTPVAEDFPLSGFSKMGVVDYNWSDTSFALLAGGVTAEGELSSKVWGFDGINWAVINDNDLPALNHPMMARYVVYRDTPIVFTQREFEVWLLFGGIDEDLEMNRSVYMSYDNGVHWSLAPEKMQFPEVVPALENADVIVAGYELSADLADAWTKQDTGFKSLWTRTSYVVEGTEIKWMCPYLYIFGGYGEDDSLSTNIWRGVLARLRFTPII